MNCNVLHTFNKPDCCEASAITHAMRCLLSHVMAFVLPLWTPIKGGGIIVVSFTNIPHIFTGNIIFISWFLFFFLITSHPCNTCTTIIYEFINWKSDNNTWIYSHGRNRRGMSCQQLWIFSVKLDYRICKPSQHSCLGPKNIWYSITWLFFHCHFAFKVSKV